VVAKDSRVIVPWQEGAKSDVDCCRWLMSLHAIPNILNGPMDSGGIQAERAQGTAAMIGTDPIWSGLIVDRPVVLIDMMAAVSKDNSPVLHVCLQGLVVVVRRTW